jgi:hypothetical protein
MRSLFLALALALVSIGSANTDSIYAATTDGPDRLTVRVRETAGIRRFGYPVSAQLKIDPPAPPATKFRLLYLGKPVAAQFRPIGRKGDQISSVALDFDSNFMPHESREYVVEFGDNVTPHEPDRGMLAEETDDSFVISNGPNLVWSVPKDLSNLIRSVKTPKWDYLRADSAGLAVRFRNGHASKLADARMWRTKEGIAKQGPIDCELHFEGTGLLDQNQDVAWKLELGFPRSKSWVRVQWQIEDPKHFVNGLSANLNLQTGDGPTLVDFGMDDLVYAAVPEGQMVVLEANAREPGARKQNDPPLPTWTTYRGRPDELEPYVVGGTGESGMLRGWAHVMDRQRCAAVAIDGFADRASDRIEVSSDGRLVISRGIPAQLLDSHGNLKKFDFWVHFVPFPPHVGAVTSPQSMQSPLEVQCTRHESTSSRELQVEGSL